jgi:hypothetical protein
MRKQALKLFFVVYLSVLLAVVSFAANSELKLRATIPFDFTVGEKTLPAGTYTVEELNSNGVLLIRSEDFTRGTFINSGATLHRNDPENAKLTFRKYGDLYFLAEVWGYYAGQEFSRSRKERQVIREMRRQHLAKEAAEPELVYIIAN